MHILAQAATRVHNVYKISGKLCYCTEILSLKQTNYLDFKTSGAIYTRQSKAGH